MKEDALRFYLELSAQAIAQQLLEITHRHSPEPGHRQVPFTAVETLLCYGLFYLLDPHRYGGGNIEKVPPIVKTLAAFFHRSPGSLTNKMLNLDGSRTHSGREEPLLFATLAASEPARYVALYHVILSTARDLKIDEDRLPDFLNAIALDTKEEDLLGQDDVPASTALLLEDADDTLKEIDGMFALGEQLTEKLVERKIRLAQHHFALEVLQNYERRCVFCGFEPRSLPGRSGLLRASHIKPWAVSTSRERVDVRNGLAACPMHDAAFDQGYLTVNGGYRIHRAHLLEESVIKDQGASYYFGAVLQPILVFPKHAKMPAIQYLTYHQEHIFKG
ncbi:MAG: HNH endonuclease [Ktedonobacteraceae bacterium]|nr:HNH endonuclease [Ktedonobacteraceae bacterium]